MNQHLLWVRHERQLGSLTRRSVHPASPVLLTKNGPLEAYIRASLHNARDALTYLKFENRSRKYIPNPSNHSLYLIKLSASAILRETSEGTSY